MVKRDAVLPTKLKNDAILEALVEFRFDTTSIPEVLLGRLIDHANWQGWQQRQLPAYNLPVQLRRLDPNMQYIPIIELADSSNKAALRIGPSAVSYHQQLPYVGWRKLKPELDKVVDSLFNSAENVKVKRIGLRYMNALRPLLHHISSITDLDLRLVVSDDVISTGINVNVTSAVRADTTCTVRVATKEFIQAGATVPADASVFIDVDVFTNEGFGTADRAVVREWVEFAHTEEKREFFRLLKQQTIDALREE